MARATTNWGGTQPIDGAKLKSAFVPDPEYSNV